MTVDGVGAMPTMSSSRSHGGLLYYVVQVPKEPLSITTSHGYLEEPHQPVTSTPNNSAVQDHSTDSGWDNPFRPDGDLSREADEIVELIKGGKPITGTAGHVANESMVSTDHTITTTTTTTTASSPKGPKGANGTSPSVPATAASSGPGAVELQRATVAPSDASQVEHIVLKKKPKCKCCVIQ